MPLNEINYILYYISNKLEEELIDYYSFLKSKDFRCNFSDRKEIIKNYYSILKIFIEVNNYSDNYNLIDEEENILEDCLKDNIEEKKFIFAASNLTPFKAKILIDIESIPKENYNNILKLLLSFKKGILSHKNIKRLSNNKNSLGIWELKYDQIRIVYKPIKDNIYCIMGLFVKKAMNDFKTYYTYANRILPKLENEQDLNNQLELGLKINEQLTNYLIENERKSTR